MRKTQVYLSESEYAHLREEAYQHHKTMSAVLREILAKYWWNPMRESKKSLLRKLVGLDSCGAKDVAKRHDDYLAGLIS